MDSQTICATVPISCYLWTLRLYVRPSPFPKHIILAYVPASDEEQLLEEFDFFIFPVRLGLLADFDEHGRQRRHDRSLAENYVLKSLQTALLEFNEVKRRLSSASHREPLFLPPQNFKVSGTKRMADTFRGLTRQTASWAGPATPLQSVKVTHEDLPKHVPRGARKIMLADSRGLLFPNDHSLHGPSRELDKAATLTDRKLLMRSSFRFGVPLVAGYHHDVQYVGRGLYGEQFECAQQGPVELTCAYANVYPNDYVRPSKK